MTKKTLEALKGSIKKWEGIVAGTLSDEGPENCPLCHLFYINKSEPPENDCKGCPVRKSTRKTYCQGTPYGDFRWWNYCNRLRAKSEAKKMLAFLKPLLPKGNQA